MEEGLGVTLCPDSYSGVQQESFSITFVFLDCLPGGSVKRDTCKQTTVVVQLNKEGQTKIAILVISLKKQEKKKKKLLEEKSVILCSYYVERGVKAGKR